MAADSFTDSTNPRYDAAPAWVNRNPRYDITQILAQAIAAKDAELSRAIDQIKGSSEDRRQAALYFAKCKNPAHFPYLEALGNDQNDHTRYLVVETVSGFDLPEATPLLIRALKDDNAHIRALVCLGLCKRPSQDVIDALAWHLWDEHHPEIREYVKGALSAIEGHPQTHSKGRYIIGALNRALPMPQARM